MPLEAAKIPSDHAGRMGLWIRSGLWLSCSEGPFVTLSIRTLGYAERLILDQEQRIAAIADNRALRTELETLLMECAAHSILWIFGLYEVVRVVKDTNPARFDAIKGLFENLEILRMPLAKHQTKNAAGYRDTLHYPLGIWFDHGSVGWEVLDPHTKAVRRLTRTDIANEFLSITAATPIFHPVETAR